MSLPELRENNAVFDEQLGMALKLAEFNRLEAQRLATDCARLLSASTQAAGSLKEKGFFQRVWSKLGGRDEALRNLNINNP